MRPTPQSIGPSEAREILMSETARRTARGMNSTAAAMAAEAKHPALADIAGQHTDPMTPTDQDRAVAAERGISAEMLMAERASYGRTTTRSSAMTEATPASAHGKLLQLAEAHRREHPTMTKEGAYVEATKQHPELFAEANSPDGRRAAVAEDALLHAHDHEKVGTFAESPAGLAHAQLQAAAQQIRQHPGNYRMTAEQAYAEAARLHPDLLASAMTPR
jgi:hypothetical protein